MGKFLLVSFWKDLLSVLKGWVDRRERVRRVVTELFARMAAPKFHITNQFTWRTTTKMTFFKKKKRIRVERKKALEKMFVERKCHS